MAGDVPLSERVCLVTGGASGIGWALVKALAREGASVHACDVEGSLDPPRFLPAVDLLFALAPGLTRWFATVGGAGRRDYSLPRGGVRTGDPS